jgi:hypothetical protein
MRIKLDKILVHIGLEICILSKSMPPLGTFVAYRIQSCCIEDWAFSEKSIYITAILLSAFTFLHAYTQNPKKNLLYIIFPVKLAKQYL